jgi:GDP-L-fucose synthase
MTVNKSDKIYVAGHNGLVGSAIMRALMKADYTNLLCRGHSELDLTEQMAVNDFFAKERPDYVFLAAAKVGGILANNVYRGDFIYSNLAIQNNVIEAARRYGTQRLLFLGSSCIYPRDCRQPMREEYLLTGLLEQTNEPYAIAKIAGIKLCEAYNSQYGTDFAAVMPTNLYGENDNFSLETSHVLPALIRKVHNAKVIHSPSVTIWGTGTVKREFLHVDDMAEACLFMMNKKGYKDIVNIGCGKEISIHDVAELICEIVGFAGKIVYDSTKPDGTPRKLLDTTRINRLGWSPRIKLVDGLAKTYQWFLKEYQEQQLA